MKQFICFLNSKYNRIEYRLILLSLVFIFLICGCSELDSGGPRELGINENEVKIMPKESALKLLRNYGYTVTKETIVLNCAGTFGGTKAQLTFRYSKLERPAYACGSSGGESCLLTLVSYSKDFPCYDHSANHMPTFFNKEDVIDIVSALVSLGVKFE